MAMGMMRGREKEFNRAMKKREGLYSTPESKKQGALSRSMYHGYLKNQKERKNMNPSWLEQHKAKHGIAQRQSCISAVYVATPEGESLSIKDPDASYEISRENLAKINSMKNPNAALKRYKRKLRRLSGAEGDFSYTTRQGTFIGINSIREAKQVLNLGMTPVVGVKHPITGRVHRITSENYNRKLAGWQKGKRGGLSRRSKTGKRVYKKKSTGKWGKPDVAIARGEKKYPLPPMPKDHYGNPMPKYGLRHPYPEGHDLS